MSDAPREARSFEIINDADLERLAELGRAKLMHICRPINKSRVFAARLRLLCFCQGAALHHRQCQTAVPLDRQRGISDFDVWGFFEALRGHSFVSRKPWECDFGPSRFGRDPGNRRRQGRKVDVLGRAIPFEDGEGAIDAVLRWLARSDGSPAWLRARPIYVISPGPDFGRMIWPGEPNG